MSSAVVHAIALLILGLWTLAAVEESDRFGLVSRVAETDEAIEEIELEEPIELEDPELPVMDAELPDPGAMSLGEVASEESVPSEIGVGQVEVSVAGEIEGLFDERGLGMSKSGTGKGAASFFGVQTKGQRFVFVVDNSNSMSAGKFEMAVAELIKSVGQLDKYQQFYVIFFSDTAYPLFYPHAVDRLMPATEDNKRKLDYWLRTVERCLQTRGSEAMERAFALRPDAIFILGDGSFTDKTVPEVLARNDTHVTIHTLGFKMNAKAKKGMEDIAAKFRGKFTDVQVTPEMVKRSKQLNRPRNNTQNGVWGIELGKGKKKAKKKKKK